MAKTFGASHLATGHYVRLQHGSDGTTLLRGLDHNKDQSYFLYGVPQEVLTHLICPLGELVKEESRIEAKRLGMPNWAKPDSQELCFVPDGDVRGFIERETGQSAAAGNIVDHEGKVLGRHAGIEGFTVGQRRGIGISQSEPRYVLKVLDDVNTIQVGPKSALLRDRLCARDVNWTQREPAGEFRGAVRIRYRHAPAEATITPTSDGFEVVFDDPQSAVAPGQAAVIYDGDAVVGGGIIEA